MRVFFLSWRGAALALGLAALFGGITVTRPVPIDRVISFGGQAYVFPVDTLFAFLVASGDDFGAQYRRSTLRLREDSQPVGRAHSRHDAIRQHGGRQGDFPTGAICSCSSRPVIVVILGKTVTVMNSKRGTF